ncbi:CAP domain-containing protein [Oceanobacillus manasiensis]|uniref:CAP domain-containing protein n=1 Tax=Oceanobacillus manasiensis TaxID=586413 RepID=UPI0005A65199|nr:CAP domain-containing protein [Oceanobacillus manasiensis]
MFKKVSIVTALSAALLFGGAFQNSVDAQAKDLNQNHIYKIYYSINGNWDKVSDNNINELVNKYLSMFQLNWKDFNWNKIQVEQKENTGSKEEVKQPENQEEQPAKEEKADEPKEQVVEKEEPKQEESKQEEPKQEQTEEKTPVEEEQPKQEQPKQDEPKEENTEAPAPQQPVAEENQQAEEQQNQSSELSQFEQEVVELTNQERAKQGLSPLKIDTELSKVAREKSRDMASNGYFAHNSPSYGSPFDMMKQFGISYSTAGENIAKGQRTPQEVVNAWMNSEGHRANIMNGNFTHIGVGYVEQGNHWTQQFIGK